MNTLTQYFDDNKEQQIIFTELNDPTTKAAALELHEKIERFTKLVHFAFIKITYPGVLIPALGLTGVNYFILDLGAESYYLASPIS